MVSHRKTHFGEKVKDVFCPVCSAAFYNKFAMQVTNKQTKKKQKTKKIVILYSQGCGEPPANSPNASRIQVWRVKMQNHSPGWRGFFPFGLTLSIFLASCFLIWRVKIPNYLPGWRVS
jgi:hypothetical protein